MMAGNIAAWNTALGVPFEIEPAPLVTPAENQILVKNHAIAINPVDGKLQYAALYPVTYPTILGQDVAGEVVTLGPGVTRFKIGDRVTGFAVGHATKCESEKAFQAYTILRVNMVCKIPDNIPFANAVVLGLALSTAADGLFNTNFLNLQLPTEPARHPTKKTLLVWGGASSVGSNAIQLAVAAGYEVITTASPKNFQYVKNLGASQVLDYASPTIVSDLVESFNGKDSVGAFDAIGAPAWKYVLELVTRTKGTKFVATVAFGHPELEGVTVKKVFAPSCKDNFVGKAIWEDFLPLALENGSYALAPEALIAGRGLESLQGAVDLLREGISARKVVVLL
ncbi:zinc-binding oxidoreductase CipB [Tricladium varicosporioides]|nr:zinc-binding oxidoreductase CipB [Hymenoscyphus varicosporioides]